MSDRMCKICLEFKDENLFRRLVGQPFCIKGRHLSRVCSDCEMIRASHKSQQSKADDYADWVQLHGAQCGICKKQENSQYRRRLSWDHNHKTGEFRGFLCSKCNQGIGLLGDSPKILASAIDYLKQRGYYGED